MSRFKKIAAVAAITFFILNVKILWPLRKPDPYGSGLLEEHGSEKNTDQTDDPRKSDKKASLGLPGAHHLSRPPQLKQHDFNDDPGHYTEHQDRLQLESVDAWRSPDSLHRSGYEWDSARPVAPSFKTFENKGEFLKYPIVNDYARGAERIFLMIKTGGTVMWDRLPVHLYTTLTKVPNFALYADRSGSVGGHEVIDILAGVTNETYNSQAFELYKQLEMFHDKHLNVSPDRAKSNSGWDLDKYKNIPMLHHAYQTSPKSDWFVFMDADTYILIDTLIGMLDKYDPNEPLYFGSPVGYPRFAHGGSGVVISRKALELGIGTRPDSLASYEDVASKDCCGDDVVRIMLYYMAGIEISGEVHQRSYFQGEPPNSVEVFEEYFCSGLATFHHLNPHDIEILYEWERLKGPERRGSLKYQDYYRDFVQPYITDVRSDWDNLSKEWVFPVPENAPEGRYSASDRTKDYHTSQEACRRGCSEKDKCYQWSYSAKNKVCKLDFRIRIGHSLDPTILKEKRLGNREGTVSGWQIDKIRTMRAGKECDPLYNKTVDEPELSPDGESRREGWFLRQSLLDTSKRTRISMEDALAKLRKTDR